MSTATLIVDLDLDRISKRLGESASEQLVWQAAERIANAIRTDGLFGTFGPGRFKVSLYKRADESAVDGLSDRLHSTLRAPFDIAGNDVFMSASIGVAMGHLGDDLTVAATKAAYHVKRNGGDATFVIRTGVPDEQPQQAA
jgi:GGDEF domain-containing protein